jgi:hypothetical protein
MVEEVVGGMVRVGSEAPHSFCRLHRTAHQLHQVGREEHVGGVLRIIRLPTTAAERPLH